MQENTLELCSGSVLQNRSSLSVSPASRGESVVLTVHETFMKLKSKSPLLSFMNRSEEHTSELQSLTNLVCRLLLEKKKKKNIQQTISKNKDMLRSHKYINKE